MLLSRISLAALRTFAEVARTHSLSRAAEQLCISQSAVSHQMKLLEQQLEVSLFIRRTRGVELTEAGKVLADYAGGAMQQLESGLKEAQRRDQQSVLRIAAIPTLSQQWLLPRLQSFHSAYPEIELQLHNRDQLVDFNQQPWDLHLHFGHGEYVGLTSELLMPEHAIPVAAPSLLSRFDTPAQLLLSGDVRRLNYLPDEEDQPGGASWTAWFKRAQLPENRRQPRAGFSHLGLALSAARHGQGMALAWQQLIQQELREGSLVALSDTALPLKYSYYAVAPAHQLQKPAVQRFMSWLKDQTETAKTA